MLLQQCVRLHTDHVIQSLVRQFSVICLVAFGTVVGEGETAFGAIYFCLSIVNITRAG